METYATRTIESELNTSEVEILIPEGHNDTIDIWVAHGKRQICLPLTLKEAHDFQHILEDAMRVLEAKQTIAAAGLAS